jgi:hypothetical protein
LLGPVDDGGLTLKRLSPSLPWGCGGVSWEGTFGCFWILRLRILRKALTLPGFRVQVLLRQMSMYRRRSSSGKCSGRSPFNWRRRDMKSLQTLHLASEAKGGHDGSRKVWSTVSDRVHKIQRVMGLTGCPPSWLMASSVGSFEAYPSSTPVSV